MLQVRQELMELLRLREQVLETMGVGQLML